MTAPVQASVEKAPAAPAAENDVLVRHPVIVVCIPAYNEERLLQRAIDSLRRQSWTDFAALIADNASTDGTEAIGRAAAAADPRFHYHRQAENIGSAGNFEWTRRASASPLLMWLGAHDHVAPSFLEKLVPPMLANPAISVSYCYTALVDRDDRVARVAASRGLDRADESPLKRFVAASRRIDFSTEINNVIRRDMLTMRFERIWGMDRIMLSQLAYRGPYHCVSEVLYSMMREPEESRSQDYMERLTGKRGQGENRRQFIRLYEEEAERLAGPGWRTRAAVFALRAMLEQWYLPTREIGLPALVLRTVAAMRGWLRRPARVRS